MPRFRLVFQFARQFLEASRGGGITRKLSDIRTSCAVGNSRIEPMAPAAPLFLAPPQIVDDILANVSSDSIPTPATAADAQLEASSADEADTEATGGHEFLDMVRSGFPSQFLPPFPPRGAPFSYADVLGNVMGRTENFSATYLSSGDACLDFFFHVVPSTSEETVAELLERAWKVDALTALKLVFHLRGVRGTGKSDKQTFYGAARWLHTHHPATLLENMPMVAEFGYFKDLLELVLRLVEGPEETEQKADAKIKHKGIIAKGKATAKLWEKIKEEKQRTKKRAPPDADTEMDSGSSDGGFGTAMVGYGRGMSAYGRGFRRSVPRRRHSRLPKEEGYYGRKGAAARAAKEAGSLKPREERVAESVARDQAASEQAASARKDKRLELARRVAKLYTNDPGFQRLYSKVADVFAERLKGDVKALQENRLFDVSLAGKWAPSLDSSYDRTTLLCYAIATRMFPKEAHPEYEALDDQKYGFAVRDRLRREVFVPLRKALELPEVYMSAQRWGDVNYRRVASVAMTNYKGLFQKHDEERFVKFLDSVKKGEARVAAGALLPHDIVRQAVTEDQQSAEVAELQWKRMVEDLKEHGKLSNCIAVCDVSGSMGGVPMEVCIALGMLLADLSEEPWKGNVITFSAIPEIHFLKGETLKERHNFAQRMKWGMNTNLQLVFDEILSLARSRKLAPEKMIKRLFIFSDMEFDAASANPWETDYQAISRKFKKAGYGSPPEIVFWNLRDSGSVPVLKSQQGVALVSGFSKNILKIFLEEDGSIDPLKAMRKAISGEEYSKLKVVD